jgi:hypothetical protein
MKRLLAVAMMIAALAAALWAGTRVAPTTEAPQVASVRSVVNPAKAAEGVQVHGHWQIEVRDPDGSTVETREFENDFYGGVALTDILLRNRTPAPWVVKLHGSAPSTHPCTFDGAAFPCSITEASSSLIAKSCCFLSKNLVKEDLDTSFRLRGNATASRDGDIGAVQTVLPSCVPNTAPSSCKSGTEALFTSTTVSPVSVLNGQQVLVVVTISFS